MARKTKVVAIGVVTAFAVVLISWPLASQTSSEDQNQQPSVEGVTRFVYSGGALEGIRKVTEDAPRSTTSTVFTNLAGATTSWFVPVGDSDLLNLGFSAECRLINSMLSNANQDWVEIRALLSRSPALAGFPLFMEPYDTVSPMAFCSANGYAMHHANWAARVTGGTTGANYIVQIQFRVANNAPLANALGPLTAWLDDWKLELAAHN